NRGASLSGRSAATLLGETIAPSTPRRPLEPLTSSPPPDPLARATVIPGIEESQSEEPEEFEESEESGASSDAYAPHSQRENQKHWAPLLMISVMAVLTYSGSPFPAPPGHLSLPLEKTIKMFDSVSLLPS